MEEKNQSKPNQHEAIILHGTYRMWGIKREKVSYIIVFRKRLFLLLFVNIEEREKI